MSIKYSTLIYYGFKVTKSMLQDLHSQDKDIEFQEDNYAVAADGWYPAISDYVYGISQGFISPGYIIEMPTKINYTKDDLNKMISNFKKYFPNEKDYTPKVWIISQVD